MNPELRDKLLSVGVATLVVMLFKRGLQSRVIVGLPPMNPEFSKVCGPAWTIRHIPVREDIRANVASGTIANPHRAALDAAPAGSVIVCDTGDHPELAAMGYIIATSLMVRGVAGILIDTGLADADAIAAMPFPVFSAGSAPVPSTARVMGVDHSLPIGIRGVAIFPGDIIVGDRNGAICIPAEMAEAVADEAIDYEKLEGFVLERIKAGAPLAGTYPPNAETLAAYRATLKTP